MRNFRLENYSRVQLQPEIFAAIAFETFEFTLCQCIQDFNLNLNLKHLLGVLRQVDSALEWAPDI